MEFWKNIPADSTQETSVSDSTCPFCKMVVEKLYQMIEDKKSEVSKKKKIKICHDFILY